MQYNFEQFVDSLFRFALSLSRDRHWAEDLTQECLLRAIKSQSRLRDGQSIKPWLFQILVNVWKDEVKKNRPRIDEVSTTQLSSNNSLSPDDHLEQREQCDLILESMQSLPAMQRNAMFLKVVESFSISEISELLNTTQNAVKANLSIARKTLRQKLSPNELEKQDRR